MPSKKKAKGQARKAEKEKRAEQARALQRASCKHFTMPKNATLDDFIAAYRLLHEYMNKSLDDFDAEETYGKYFEFDDARKQVFRNLAVAKGTSECVLAAEQKDLTKEKGMVAWYYIDLLSMIECLEKCDGTISHVSVQCTIEFTKQLNTTAFYPREIVRFFHRCNSCSCLHEIYYKLKDTTQRTIDCWNCNKVVDIKKAFHCKCEMANYCSEKCALDYWPEHKEDCRQAREAKGLK
jgi:hypothetical protein